MLALLQEYFSISFQNEINPIVVTVFPIDNQKETVFPFNNQKEKLSPRSDLFNFVRN